MGGTKERKGKEGAVNQILMAEYIRDLGIREGYLQLLEACPYSIGSEKSQKTDKETTGCEKLRSCWSFFIDCMTCA